MSDILFVSYALHSKFTFGTPFGRRSLWGFFQAMVFFQALDYLLFVVIFTRFGIESTLVILLCTGIVFLVRFVFVRRTLRGGGAGIRAGRRPDE